MTRFTNALGCLVITLKAGVVMLAGSLAQLVRCKRRGHPCVTIAGMGSASERFV